MAGTKLNALIGSTASLPEGTPTVIRNSFAEQLFSIRMADGRPLAAIIKGFMFPEWIKTSGVGENLAYKDAAVRAPIVAGGSGITEVAESSLLNGRKTWSFTGGQTYRLRDTGVILPQSYTLFVPHAAPATATGTVRNLLYGSVSSGASAALRAAYSNSGITVYQRGNNVTYGRSFGLPRPSLLVITYDETEELLEFTHNSYLARASIADCLPPPSNQVNFDLGNYSSGSESYDTEIAGALIIEGSMLEADAEQLAIRSAIQDAFATYYGITIA